MLIFPSIKYSIKFFVFFTLLLGIIYPLTIYFTGQIFFPENANGNLCFKNGKVIGSYLLGQKFTSNKYFWSRPSAIDYNPYPSGGSNFSQTSDSLLKLFTKREKIFIEKNKLPKSIQVPTEMLFSSASGVDPDISEESAMMQAKRVIIARNFNKLQSEKLIKLISRLSKPAQFGILGNRVVNVLMLNINLDKLNKKNE